ncbi:MAG: hypothetical protein ACE5H9_15200 [Anaerolineae bacterium]
MEDRSLVVATGRSILWATATNLDRWEVEDVLQGPYAHTLTRDPGDPNHLLAGTIGHGVYRSVDGGRTWTLTTPPPHPRIFSVAISPTERNEHGGALYIGSEPSAIFRSYDGGQTWQELAGFHNISSRDSWFYPRRPYTSHVRCIALKPDDSAVILAGIDIGGVMRSADCGQTWTDHRPGAFKDCHSLQFHPVATERVYQGAASGVALSRDGGRRWESCGEGMYHHYAWTCAVDALDPGLVYVAAAWGPHYAHKDDNAMAYIYRRRAKMWATLAGGLPQPLESMVYALLTRPGEPGVVYAGLRNGDIWFSQDAGDTWQKLPLNLRRIWALA